MHLPDLESTLGHEALPTASLQQSLSLALSELKDAHGCGKVGVALRAGRRAVEIAELTGDKRSEMEAAYYYRAALHDIGDLAATRAKLEHALQLARELGDTRRLGLCLSCLGCMLRRDRRAQEAAQYFNEALGIASDRTDAYLECYCLVQLGNAKGDLGLDEEGVQLLRAAVRSSERIQDARKRSELGGIALGSLGRALSGIDYRGKRWSAEVRNLEEGVHCLQRYCKLATDIGDANMITAVYRHLGVAFAEQQHWQLAEQMLGQAEASFEQQWCPVDADNERKAFRDTWLPVDIGRWQQEVLVAQCRPAEALLAAERSRARAFAALLSQDIDAVKHVTVLLDWASASSIVVDQGCTVIYYSVISDIVVLAWVLDRSGMILGVQRLSLLEPLSSFIDVFNRAVHCCGRNANCDQDDLDPLEFLESLTNQDFEGCDLEQNEISSSEDHTRGIKDKLAAMQSRRQALDQKLHAMYASLFSPIDHLIQSGAHLLVIPEGQLLGVPYAALLDGSGTYLVEKHCIRVSPSLGSLRLLRSRGDTHTGGVPSALVAGLSQFLGTPCGIPLEPLPCVDQELAAVSAACQQSEMAVTMLAGVDMTKARIVQEAVQATHIVHLATHHLPQRKSLVVHGRCEADVLLSESDIYAVSLHTRLAVLSACSTLEGKPGADGIAGMCRAFCASGASSVMASLWAVRDRSTCEFMRLFYSSCLQQHLPVPEAAQVAMVHMLRAKVLDSFPKYSAAQWAPFVVLGNSVTL
mmetsp:Transcript_1006/g.4098  ORF Transcript_1006/g.4098 Transcript_1006/m.4098 type:complete len:753 (-) Transcript_1006:353-2611(-)